MALGLSWKTEIMFIHVFLINDRNEVSQEEDDEDDIPEGVDMSDPFFSQGFGPDFPDNNNERVKTKSVAKKKGKKQETEEDKKRKVLFLFNLVCI